MMLELPYQIPGFFPLDLPSPTSPVAASTLTNMPTVLCSSSSSSSLLSPLSPVMPTTFPGAAVSQGQTLGAADELVQEYTHHYNNDALFTAIVIPSGSLSTFPNPPTFPNPTVLNMPNPGRNGKKSPAKPPPAGSLASSSSLATLASSPAADLPASSFVSPLTAAAPSLISTCIPIPIPTTTPTHQTTTTTTTTTATATAKIIPPEATLKSISPAMSTTTTTFLPAAPTTNAHAHANPITAALSLKSLVANSSARSPLSFFSSCQTPLPTSSLLSCTQSMPTVPTHHQLQRSGSVSSTLSLSASSIFAFPSLPPMSMPPMSMPMPIINNPISPTNSLLTSNPTSDHSPELEPIHCDSFELNPLQEALQAGLGENLLSGLAFSDDLEVQLSSPQKVVDVSCRDNHFCLGYESEREDLMDSIDFSLLSLPPRATFTVSPEDDDDDEDDEDLFADDRRGMDLLEMRACESDGLLDLDDDEEVYTAASIPATAASAVKPSTKRTNTKSRSKTLSTAPTFPTSPLTQSIAAAPLPPPLPETCPVRYSHRQTIYEEFTAKGIDWCRYCGVTKGGQTAAFRPGPWGRRTLCNKHGCDYKGYGYADKQSRLDLSKFRKESVQDRIRPVLQDFCIVCFQRTSPNGSVLVQCDGCPRGHHVECHGGIPHRIWSAALTSSNKTSDSDDPEEEDSTHSHHQQPWYCSDTCSTSRKTTRINLELPKKNLPFMNCSGISNQHRRTSSSGSSTSSLSPTPDSDPCSSPPLLADDWAKLERRDSGLDLAMPHHASSRRRDSVAVGTRSRYQPYDTRTRRQSHAH